MTDMFTLIRQGVRLKKVEKEPHRASIVTSSVDKQTQELKEALERISRNLNVSDSDDETPESNNEFED